MRYERPSFEMTNEAYAMATVKNAQHFIKMLESEAEDLTENECVRPMPKVASEYIDILEKLRAIRDKLEAWAEKEQDHIKEALEWYRKTKF